MDSEFIATSTDIREGPNREKPEKGREKRNQHRVARIPPAKQERVRQRYLVGQSISMVSREERRDRRTIANVIQKTFAKLKEFIETNRAQFLALIPLARSAIKKGMENGQTDVAYKFLTDAGVVGSTIVRANEFANRKFRAPIRIGSVPHQYVENSQKAHRGF
jgi:hypothetical protein